MGDFGMNDYWSRISFRFAAFYGGYIWFCNLYYPALFKMNLSTGEISLEKILPRYTYRNYAQYGLIVSIEGQLIIAPLRAGNILFYDIEKKELNEIPLEIEKYSYGIDSTNLFWSSAVYDENIFLFPGHFRAIVKIDVKTKKITYISRWFDELKDEIFHERRLIFSKCYSNDGENYYLPSFQSNIVLKFNLRLLNYEVIRTNIPEERLSGIVVDEQYYWITSTMSNILYRIDKYSMKIKSIEVTGIDNSERKGLNAIIPYKDLFYLLPCYIGNIVAYNKADETCTQSLIMPKQAVDDMKQYIYELESILYCQKVENHMYLYSYLVGKLYDYNMDNNVFEVTEIKVNKYEEYCYIKNVLPLALRESNDKTLRQYIYEVKNYKRILQTINKNKIEVGRQIHKSIIQH